MDEVSDFADPLYDSNETIVDQTDEDSLKDHSSVERDDGIVPKLRRTKSILVCLTL